MSYWKEVWLWLKPGPREVAEFLKIAGSYVMFLLSIAGVVAVLVLLLKALVG